MRCPHEERLLLLAAGGLSGRKQRRYLSHVEQCGRCREEYEAASRAVRVGFPALMRGRGFSPAAPSERTREILEAIDACPAATGGRVLPGTFRRTRRRIGMAAAVAVVVLAALLARFLGEPRWTGRPELARGALLCSRRGEPFTALPRTGSKVGPGDVVYALVDSQATLDMEGGGRLTLDGPAILALGRGGESPLAVLTLGVAEVERGNRPSLRFCAGDRTFDVKGTAEFSVSVPDRSQALARARALAAGFDSGGLLGITPLFAAVTTRASVSVHALSGRVLPLGPGLPALMPGEEWTAPGAAAPAWAGEEARYASRATTLLTEEELSRLPALLPPGQPAIDSLVAAAHDRSRSGRDRALAVWLLGEIGQSDIRTRIRDCMADPDDLVAGAAVRALGRLGDWSSIDVEALKALDANSRPVVAEAMVQALAQNPARAVPAALVAYAAQTDHPAWVRALAAAAAAARGASLPVDVLRSIADAGEQTLPIVLKLAAETGAEGRAFLVEQARTPGPDRVRALEYLSSLKIEGLESMAEKTAAASADSDPDLYSGCLVYLASVAPRRLVPLAAAALDSGDLERTRAAIKALGRAGVVNLDFDAYRTLIPRIAAAAEKADPQDEELLLPALTSLRIELGIDRLCDLATEGTVSVRTSAIQAMEPQLVHPGNADLSRVRSVLAAAVRDGCPRVSAAAWGEIGQVAPREMLVLARERIDGFKGERLDALLGGIEAALRNGLTPEESVSTAELLGRIVLLRRSPAVRRRAIEGLRRLVSQGTPEAETSLCRALDAASLRPSERTQAAIALGETPRPGRILPQIAAILDSGGDPARGLAAGLLALAPRTGLAGILEAPDAASASPLRRSLRALAGGPDDPAVDEMLRSEDSALAEFALLHLPPALVDAHEAAVVARLQAPSPDLRLLAALALAGKSGEPAEALAPALDDPDPLVAAVAAAGRFAAGDGVSPEALALRLTRAADVPDMRFLRRKLSTWTADGVKPLEQVFSGADSAPERRDLAGSVLGAIRMSRRLHDLRNRADATAPPPVTDTRQPTALQDRQSALDVLAGRQTGSETLACERLGRRGTRADLTLLFALASGRDPALAAKARASLRELLARRPGPELESWWAPRAFALDVPVLARKETETR